MSNEQRVSPLGVSAIQDEGRIYYFNCIANNIPERILQRLRDGHKASTRRTFMCDKVDDKAGVMAYVFQQGHEVLKLTEKYGNWVPKIVPRTDGMVISDISVLPYIAKNLAYLPHFNRWVCGHSHLATGLDGLLAGEGYMTIPNGKEKVTVVHGITRNEWFELMQFISKDSDGSFNNITKVLRRIMAASAVKTLTPTYCHGGDVLEKGRTEHSTCTIDGRILVRLSYFNKCIGLPENNRRWLHQHPSVQAIMEIDGRLWHSKCSAWIVENLYDDKRHKIDKDVMTFNTSKLVKLAEATNASGEFLNFKGAISQVEAACSAESAVMVMDGVGEAIEQDLTERVDEAHTRSALDNLKSLDPTSPVISYIKDMNKGGVPEQLTEAVTWMRTYSQAKNEFRGSMGLKLRLSGTYRVMPMPFVNEAMNRYIGRDASDWLDHSTNDGERIPMVLCKDGKTAFCRVKDCDTVIHETLGTMDFDDTIEVVARRVIRDNIMDTLGFRYPPNINGTVEFITMNLAKEMKVYPSLKPLRIGETMKSKPLNVCWTNAEHTVTDEINLVHKIRGGKAITVNDYDNLTWNSDIKVFLSMGPFTNRVMIGRRSFADGQYCDKPSDKSMEYLIDYMIKERNFEIDLFNLRVKLKASHDGKEKSIIRTQIKQIEEDKQTNLPSINETDGIAIIIIKAIGLNDSDVIDAENTGIGGILNVLTGIEYSVKEASLLVSKLSGLIAKGILRVPESMLANRTKSFPNCKTYADGLVEPLGRSLALISKYNEVLKAKMEKSIETAKVFLGVEDRPAMWRITGGLFNSQFHMCSALKKHYDNPSPVEGMSKTDYLNTLEETIMGRAFGSHGNQTKVMAESVAFEYFKGCLFNCTNRAAQDRWIYLTLGGLVRFTAGKLREIKFTDAIAYREEDQWLAVGWTNGRRKRGDAALAISSAASEWQCTKFHYTTKNHYWSRTENVEGEIGYDKIQDLNGLHPDSTLRRDVWIISRVKDVPARNPSCDMKALSLINIQLDNEFKYN